MNEKQITATVTFTLDEIQVLNNILQNSTPTIPFGTVTQFIAKLNGQLQAQLQEHQTKEKEFEAMKAVPKTGEKKTRRSAPTDSEGAE